MSTLIFTYMSRNKCTWVKCDKLYENQILHKNQMVNSLSPMSLVATQIWINSVLCDALLPLVPSHRMSQYYMLNIH